MTTPPQDLSSRPFGKDGLPWWARSLVHLCQMLPGNGFGKKAAFLIRKPVLKWNAGPMDVFVNGLRCRLYPHQNLSDKRLLTTPHLLDGVERAFFQKRLSPRAVVVDIGANMGAYTMLLLRERPDLHVLAIEPDPGLAKRLADNLRLNRLNDRCDLHVVAITDKPGRVRLFQHPENQGKNSLVPVAEHTSTGIEVDGQPLLSVLDCKQIKRAELLKIDVEGHEHPLLSAFFTTAPLDRWPVYIQIEQYRNEALNDAVNLCIAHGYQIVIRSRMNVVLQRSAVPNPYRTSSAG